MRIHIKGYFSCNLGDDLFVRTLAARYPNHQFVLMTKARYFAPYLDIPNIKLIRQNVLRSTINKICNFCYAPMNLYDKIEKKSDITVVIGGSLFQQISGNKREIRGASRLVRGFNPSYILGANFGPYKTQEYKVAVSKSIENALDVCFRDTKSVKLFAEYQNVRYAPDILFGMDYDAPKLEKKPYCLISIIDFTRRSYLRQYADKYNRFINCAVDFYTKQNYDVVLTSFCASEGDEEAINNILLQCNSASKARVSVLKYSGRNAEDVLSAIKNASCIIATRFHSMVMGLRYKVPLIPVVYNEKTMNVLEDLNSEEYGVLPEDLDKFSFQNIRYLVIQNVEELKVNSTMHFHYLDKVLINESKEENR